MDFPFDDAPNTAVITCYHILEGNGDICYVSHDEDDGGWQFLCDLDSHSESDARIVSLKQIFDKDPSVELLADMPLGFCAVRADKDSEWKGYKK